jgi:uncharacterized membrane protein YebE (DUF533 family)
MDPRVKVTAKDLEQQFQVESRLASMMTQSTHAVMEGRSLHEQLEKLSSTASGALAASIKELDKKASAVLSGSAGNAGGEPTLTSVNGSVTTLYGEVDRADAAPTSAQLEAVTKTEKDFSVVVKQWDELKSQDLAALNRQLSSANQQEIHLDSHGETQDGEDQDID